MLHTTTRRAMRYGRSFVLTVPYYVAQQLQVAKGDTFAIVYDDEKQTLTYRRVMSGVNGPTVEIDGEQFATRLMP